MNIWITGAGRGIGAAIARRAARAGAGIALSGRNDETLVALAAELEAAGARVCVARCDVGDEDSVRAAFEAAHGALGSIDVLVNNAGETVFLPFMKSGVADLDRLLRTNVRGAFLCTQAVLPGMLERGAGTVVMINSVASRDVFSDSSLYSASKAGLKALTDCLRHEVRKSGVRIVSIFPGATGTEIWPARVLEKHGHRMMASADVAEAVWHTLELPAGVLVEDLYMQPIGGPLS
ncbi:MAG: SDR family oxidoreductase [Ignavibacteriae bacterium]|nr:SDR family oxidoreductase [Ignavibacteriota bacterium]